MKEYILYYLSDGFFILLCVFTIVYIGLFIARKTLLIKFLSRPLYIFNNKRLNALLEKYTNSSIEGIKGVMIISYTLLYGFIFLLITKVFFTLFPHWFVNHSDTTLPSIFPHGAMFEILLHIDLAGIVTGFLGILFGIIIALIVEGENRIEKEETFNILNNKSNDVLDKANDILSSTKDIHSLTKKVIEYNTAIQPKYTLRERLKSLKRILKLTLDTNNENEIYIMNYSADFSYARSHNVEVILNSFGKGNHDLKIVKQHEYHEFYKEIDMLNRDVYDNLEKLITNYRQEKHLIHIAILGTTKDNIEYSKYEKYLRRSLESSEIVFYDQGSDLTFNNIVEDYPTFSDDERNKGKVYYAFAKRHGLGISESMVEKREELVNYLYNHNLEKINKLIDWGIEPEKILEFDSIPFQFFLSVSKSGTSKSKALITFANIDGLGSNGGIFGFETSDSNIIANLVNIFDAYSKSQSAKDEKLQPIRERKEKFSKLFNATTVTKDNIYSILKYKFIDKFEYYEGVPKTDIKAAVAIREIFYENLGIIPLPIYIGEDEKFTSIDDLIKTKKPGVYIGIGIFGSGQNPLTVAEYIINSNPDIPFELVRKSSIPKKVNMEVEKDNEKNVFYAKFNDEWERFEEIWINEDCGDFAIVGKVNITESISIIIIGGLNHYGTESIGCYLKDSWETIANEVGNSQFLYFYKIPPKVSSESIELIKKRFW